ncbi:MAG: glycosyltransferase family 4 protein [Thiothrix sp.]
MKKILFVGNDAAFFLSHRLPLAKQLGNQGYDVHVAMPEPESNPSAMSIQSHGMNYHQFSMDRMSRNPLRELNTVWSLFRLYQWVQPDLIHHIAVKAILYGGIAALLSGHTRSIYAFTGIGTLFTHQDITTRVLRTAITPVYKIIFLPSRAWAIFQNPDDLGLFTEAGITREQRSVLIRSSGVNLREFSYRPEPEGTPVIILAARMLKSKGVHEFAAAARKIHAKGLEARFVLVGEVPYNRDAVPVGVLQQWQQEGFLEWWGYRSDMADILPQTHIICLPSYREGVPKVLLEAAACGRAIVASDVPGCREITLHQQNGLLVEPRSSDALAAGIEILLRNPHKRRRLGHAGRQLVEQEFSVEQVVHQTLQVYQKLFT